MRDRSRDSIRALGRAALAALLEAVKDLVPGFGPIHAAWKTYHDALRPAGGGPRAAAGGGAGFPDAAPGAGLRCHR